MNPDTGKLELLQKSKAGQLLRPNGKPVPRHWTVFNKGEHVVCKGCTFKVVYMNEGTLILEPVKLEDVPGSEEQKQKTLEALQSERAMLRL